MVQGPRSKFERYSPFDSVASWRDTKSFSIGANKVHLARKTRCHGNFRKRHFCLCVQACGAIETNVSVVNRRALPHKSSEKTVKLTL